jgi:hypothetical protein
MVYDTSPFEPASWVITRSPRLSSMAAFSEFPYAACRGRPSSEPGGSACTTVGASYTGRPSIFAPRRSQRAPAPTVAIARRRYLAASGPMPRALATIAELAVRRIVGDEVRGRGCCDRTLAELAARAGCSRTKAQDAIRQVGRLGLLTVQERRSAGSA